MENNLLADHTAWYILGITLIILEVKLGGIGLFFAGLGAITTAAFSQFSIFGFEPSILSNVLCFLIATTIWTIILWKPFKNFTITQKGEGFSDIIGTEATTLSPIKKGGAGNVKWSGAIMRAKISITSSCSEINTGETVKIVDKVDGILIVDKESQ
ncbi:MAG TPA: hypothetical protein DIV86_00270 [Alphaproteobacteria bacterium]|nr:hypothetical protein [Alphaproteobacteria bacterium]